MDETTFVIIGVGMLIISTCWVIIYMDKVMQFVGNLFRHHPKSAKE